MRGLVIVLGFLLAVGFADVPASLAGPLSDLDLEDLIEGDEDGDWVVGEEMCVRPG